MRSFDGNIASLSWDMPSASSPQGSITIPAHGSLLGINLRLTEDAGDADGTVTSRISAAIDTIVVQDRHGAVILNLTGLQLERVANELSPAGIDVDAPAPGDGAATEWLRFIPLTIAVEDMPARINITQAPETALYSAPPTLPTAITLNIRGAYTRAKGVRTLRIKATTPTNAAGNNSLGHLLPDGELVEKLLIIPNDPGTNTIVDADITSLRLSQGGFTLLDGATIVDKFEPEDVEFRESAHNAGTINVRVPPFVVSNTTILDLQLVIAAAFDLVTISTKPQPEK